MKRVEPSTGMSKRSREEASTTAPAFGIMPAAEETFVDPTTAVDPSSGDNDVDPTVTPYFSLCVMMESFMTIQATYRQLMDELLMEVTSLRVDFAEYRSVFPPLSPSND